jgi:aspartyl-tRNA(Asn)/glutamyl-tRNA(Gln) amidotransferase subunit C
MSIDRATVDHVARLARLDLSDEERDRFTRQLAGLLEYFAALQQLDTEGIEPTSHVVEMANVTREDASRPGLTREAVLAAAPAHQDGFFKVPPVIETETPP